MSWWLESSVSKELLKMIHNKKCIIFLSTLDGEQPIIEQIGLTTRIQCTHWQKMTVNTNDTGKKLSCMQSCSSFLHNTVKVHTHITVAFWYIEGGGVCSVILLDWQKYQRAEIIFTLCTLMSPWLAAACRRHCKKENLQSWKKRRETVLSYSKQSKYTLHRLEQ